MTTEEAREKIEADLDFVYLKRYGYSLTKLMERYPDGCPDHVIAQALMITEDDVEALYQGIVEKVRGMLL